jgi:hypothetical protein
MSSPDRENDDDRKPRSSIVISDMVVCEDEACIGKTDTPPQARPEDTSRQEVNKGKSSGTSISVGGREVCSDDACIGKT